MATWFSAAFRSAPYPTLYEAHRSHVTCDVTVTSLVYVTAILLVSSFISAIGQQRGQKISCLVRSVFTVLILGAIMVCNFGQGWEVASLVTQTPYRTGTSRDINASVHVEIGLRSVNISLTGVPEVQNVTRTSTETINYNERFSWDDEGWMQGKHGEGHVQQAVRRARLRGLPLPILWVAEYFTIDGEGIRWGRHYRQAGYFTHMALWLAVPLWLLAVVLSIPVPTYGAFYAILTGLDLVGACVLFSWIRNEADLSVPFPDGRLTFTWGWTYWLCLCTGVVSFVLGVTVYVADIHFPDQVIVFFGGAVTNSLEEFYVSDLELVKLSEHDLLKAPGRLTSMDMTSPSPDTSHQGSPRSSHDFRSHFQSACVPDGCPDVKMFQQQEGEGSGYQEGRYEEVVTVNTEIRRVYRKRKRRAPFGFLRQATRVRHRLGASRTRVQPHSQSSPPRHQLYQGTSAYQHTAQTSDGCSGGGRAADYYLPSHTLSPTSHIISTLCRSPSSLSSPSGSSSSPSLR